MEKIIGRVKEILLQPKAAWEIIKTEDTSVASIMKSYVLPLALIPAIASFIGYGFVGVRVPFYGKISSFEWGLNQGITSYISMLIGIFVTGWVISWLAPKFNAKVSVDSAVKMVAYSYTPAMIAGILYIVPSLSIIVMLASIYGLYILYLGFTPITDVSEEKKTAYFVVSILVLIVLFIVIGLILAAILSAIGLSSMKM